MESVVAESTLQAVIPGKCVDIYYPDPETAEKACFRTTVNTKFVQAFANLTGGTSVFTIPPNNGVQDIVCVFKLPDLTGANTGLALPRGWGYALINKISYRIGGSSQYFLSSAQMLQYALDKCPDGESRDALLSLGGQALQPADLASANNYAYVYLSLPFSRPSSVSKPPPCPSDLLTQQIQVTVELNPLTAVFSNNGGTVPSALALAEFQVQQVMLNNKGDELARRVDMTSHSLSYPCEFVQQESIYSLQNTASSQTVSITGFRSGSVKSINIWLTRDADTAGNTKNPLNWSQPTDIIMTYAGDQYARFDGSSGNLWYLINNRKTPQATNVTFGAFTAGPPGTYAVTNSTSAWLDLPFAQAYDAETAHSMLVEGRDITNGIVQLQLTTPSAQADWKLHVSVVYASAIIFSQGTADFCF